MGETPSTSQPGFKMPRDPVQAATEITQTAKQKAQAVEAAEGIATAAAAERQTEQLLAAYDKMEDGGQFIPQHVIEGVIGETVPDEAAPMTTPQAAATAAERFGQQAHVLRQAETIANTAAAGYVPEKPVVDTVPMPQTEQPTPTPTYEEHLVDRFKKYFRGLFGGSEPRTESEPPEQSV